jgi:hypothetical protein
VLAGCWAASGWAAGERRLVSAAQGHHARQVGRGPQKAAGQNSFFFFSVIFTEYSFGDFVQILSNFHTVSSIQNNPTKFCLEKLKSNRNFSVKFKVNEFLNSCFRCK